MTKIKLICLVLVMLCASSFSIIKIISWEPQKDAYSVQFKGGRVEGRIAGLNTILTFDKSDLSASKLIAELKVNTIETGNWLMDKHATSEDALNAEKYPIIKFESIAISGNNDSYVALGNLTIKGITKEIRIPFIFEEKGAVAIFKGKFSIVPGDYNITRWGTPDVMDITVSVPVKR